jgi:hypothetical protein
VTPSAQDDPSIFLEMSEDELLAEIGRALGDRDWLPPKFETLVRSGTIWMEEQFDQIRQRVCAANVQGKLDSADGKVVVAVLADILAGLIAAPAVFSASVLVYRYGVNRLCAGNTADD